MRTALAVDARVERDRDRVRPAQRRNRVGGQAEAAVHRDRRGRRDRRPSSATRTRSASACSSRSRASTRTTTASPTGSRSTSSGPQESGPNLKVPAIIDDSPYYTSLGRGNETQFIHTTADGVLDKFPLFYDNYFVPRGYAVILAARGRHRVLDRLPAARRPGRRRRLQGGRSTGSRAASRATDATATRRSRRLGQRQERDDRQVLRRHVRQRRRRHGRRRPDDDRPDLGDLRLVRLLADGRHPVQHPLPGAASTTAITANQSRRARSASLPPDHRDRRARNVVQRAWTPIDGDADGDINAVLARPQLQQGRQQGQGRRLRVARHQRRQRPPEPDSRSGGPASPPTTCRASSGSRRRATSTRSTTAARAWVDTLHRWFDYWLQGVQNGIMNEPQRGHRDRPEHVGRLRRLAAPEHDAPRRRLPQRHAPPARPARSASARAATTSSLTFTDDNLCETN